MGMVAEFEQVTPEQLEEFIRDPRTAYDQIMSEFYEHISDPDSVASMFLTQIEALKSDPTVPAAFKSQAASITARIRSKAAGSKGPQLINPSKPSKSPKRKRFSLQKDWHMMHYALNGTAEGGEGPIADAVMGGTELPDREGLMGYGPVRYLKAQRVAEISKALKMVDSSQLISKLDAQDAKSKRIYLAHTLDRPHDWDYLPELFAAFVEFYHDAEQSGSAMLLYLT